MIATTRLFILFTLILGSLAAFAQDFPMTNGTVNTCGGLFLDDGAGASYSTTSYTFTLCPDNPGDVIQVDFFAFNLWTSPNPQNSDRLFIYDGPDTGAPSLGNYSGSQLQGLQVTGTVNNPSGCLTFVFQVNPNTAGDFPGWEAAIICTTPCDPPVASSIIENPAPSGAEQSIGVCIGDVITFSDNGSFAQPGFNIDSYVWNLGDGTIDETSGTQVEHSYDEPGEYIVTLTILDDNGCSSLNLDPLQVLVSTVPIFNIEQGFEICLGATAEISANPESTTWTALPPQVVAGTTFLADGAGFSYSTDLTFDFFEPGAVLEDCDDFLGIFVNMEHSYLGDLGMSLTCPNGTQVSIMDWPNGGGGTYLGETVDDPYDLPGENVAGVGYTYTWVPGATNGNLADQPPNMVNFTTTTGDVLNQDIVPEGSYQADGNLCDLVGCPLNGSWTFTITDNLGADNGYVFYWGIDFNPAYFPDVTTFTPVIGMESDSTFWEGPEITDVSANGNSITVTPTSTGTFDYTFSALNNFGCIQDTTISITVVPGPEADAGPDVVICDEAGQLEGSVDGLPPPPPTCDYTLEMMDSFGDGWNGFSVTIVQDGVTVGTYTFNTGTESTATIPLNHGATIQINTNSGTWDSEVSYNLLSPDGDVVFSDGEGFVAPQIGNNIWSGTVNCQPESPNYVYEWSPTTGLSDPSIANPTVLIDQNTTYTLTVWVEGSPECAGSDEVEVTIPPEADPGEDNEIVLCFNDPLFNMLDSLDGTPADTGEWTDEGGNPVNGTFTPSDHPDGGIFTFTYTVTFGPCVKTSELIIEVLEAGNPSCCQTNAEAGEGGIACDLSFELSAEPTLGSGTWSGPAGVIFSSPNNPNSTVTVPSPGGEITLYWTDDNGLNCEGSDSVSVVFMDPVEAELIVLPASCPDSCNAVALVEASGGLGVMTYQWSNGQIGDSDEERIGLCEGTVSVVVEDEYGCVFETEAAIEELDMPVIQDILETRVTCDGWCDGTIEFVAPDGAEFSIDGGLTFSNTPIFEGLCPEEYELEIRNDLNCPNYGTATINEPPPVVAAFSMAPSPTTWRNTTVNFYSLSHPEPFDSYLWVFDTLNTLGTSTEKNPTFTFPSNEGGVYPVSLCVENADGCADCVSYDLIVYETLALYVPNSFTPNGDGVNDLFKAYASTDQFSDFRMRIFNRQGELVFETGDITQGWDGGYPSDTHYVTDQVYVYEIRVYDIIGAETLEFNGHVTPLR